MAKCPLFRPTSSIDASGRGGPTLALLETLGLAKPEATEIGIEVGYSSTIFEAPEG